MTTMWDRFKTAVQAIDLAGLDRTDLGVLAGEIGSARAVLDGLEAQVAVGMRRLGASEASTAETLRGRRAARPARLSTAPGGPRSSRRCPTWGRPCRPDD